MSELDAFDYDLPGELIAQVPSAERGASRLLVDTGDAIEHRLTADLADLVGPGDVLVLNTSKVLPVRLHLQKVTGGAVEVLLLEPLTPDRTSWEALVRPSRKVPPGTRLASAHRDAASGVVVGDDLGDGRREVLLEFAGGLEETLAEIGEMPLPPYITERAASPDRYQTVYADRPGSAAAPTAGLHLTDDTLERCRQAGAAVVGVELHVGLDTFRPLTVDRLADHHMHSERYHVPEASWAAVEAAERVVAVGTTVVRTLESVAVRGELEGRTDLFIRRPYPFAVVDALMTNFHLPRSSLLVLLDAFMGPRWRDLYALARTERYRFLSFGDAMLVGRRQEAA